jgi:hypothetical protein
MRPLRLLASTSVGVLLLLLPVIAGAQTATPTPSPTPTATDTPTPGVVPTPAPVRLIEGQTSASARIAPMIYDRYLLASKGDGHAVTISLFSTAHDDSTTKEIGFDVYSPSGQHFSSTPSYATGHPWDTSTATVTLTEKGDYLIQVYNQDLFEIFGYRITVINPNAPPPPTATPVVAANAPVLNGSVTSTIAPNSYAYYKAAYQGGNQPLVVDIQIMPANVTIDQNVGVAVYDPTGQSLGRSQPTLTDGSPYDHEQVTIQSPVGGTYLLQVFNFDTGVAYAYTLGVVQVGTPTPVPTATPVGAVGKDSSGGINSGDFKLYTIHSTGSGETVLVRISTSATDEAGADSIGFDVYSPVTGTAFHSAPEHALGHPYDTSTALVKLIEKGDYTVQIYNYNTGVSFTYTLTVTPVMG